MEECANTHIRKLWSFGSRHSGWVIAGLRGTPFCPKEMSVFLSLATAACT